MITLEAWVWGCCALLLVAATAALTYALTRSRMQQEASGTRQVLADARAALEAERKSSQETIRAAEEAARRSALDEFLADMRIEERRYVREHRVLFAHRKSLVLQERMYFRNIPLSNWVEHEVPIQEGADLEDVAKTFSVFDKLQLEQPGNHRRRLLF